MSVEKYGACWPGWETVRLIGRGTYGTVYEIEREILGEVEKAALKVISIPQNPADIDEMYSDGYDTQSIAATYRGYLKSIVSEYLLMRRMNGCTNIVNCDDVRYVQHEDGFGWDIFIKMELLTPMTKALPMEVPEETVIKIARDLCTAMELCEKHGIVHRDIKPQNIFVSPNGDFKLGDFGVAKTVEKTMGGTMIGTFRYMAPEVYNNKPYGHAADIYSLGLVLYWLMNERRMPFLQEIPINLRAGMDEQARKRRLSGEKFGGPKNCSRKLKDIVMKACAYRVEDRYASASEMLAELNQLAMGYADTVPTMFSAGQTASGQTEAVPGAAVRQEVHDTLPLPEERPEDRTVVLFGDPKGKQDDDDRTVLMTAQGGSGEKAQERPAVNRKAEKSRKPRKKWPFIVGALAAVIALALVLLLPGMGKEKTTVIESSECGNNLTYKLFSDGELVIYGRGRMDSFPYEDVPWSSHLKDINVVTLEEGVQNIGMNAFLGCGKLHSVSIPETVEFIGGYAFDTCYALDNITIPDGITFIGRGAFGGCGTEKIENIYILDSGCNIWDEAGTLGDPDNVVVHGYAGSTAETYAEEYGYEFCGKKSCLVSK